MKQKVVNLNKKTKTLDHWRNLLNESITDTHLGLAGSWESCAIGERSRIEGNILTTENNLNLESRCLGYDFYIAIRNGKIERALEILEQIETLPTIWKNTK